MGDTPAKFIYNLLFSCMWKFVIVASSRADYLIHHHLCGGPNFDADGEREFVVGSEYILDELINILAWLLILNRLYCTEEGEIKSIGIWGIGWLRDELYIPTSGCHLYQHCIELFICAGFGMWCGIVLLDPHIFGTSWWPLQLDSRQ